MTKHFRAIIAAGFLVQSVLWASPVARQGRVLTAVPDLRIDGGAFDLSAITHRAVNRVGTIAIAQPQDGLIRFFDARGKPSGTFGRRGEGPGEFLQPYAMGWTGDSLWVYDQKTTRVTIIGPRRTLVRTVPVPRQLISERGKAPPPFDLSRIRALYANGDFLFSAGVPKAARPSLEKWGLSLPAAHDALLRVAPDGRFLALIAPQPDILPDCMHPILGPLPECVRTYNGFASDGSWIASLQPAGVEPKAATYIYQFRAIDLQGKVLASRNMPFEGNRLTSRQVDSIRSALVAQVTRTEAITAARQVAIPSVTEPVRWVHAGQEETIWVRLPTRDGKRGWTGYHRDGTLLGTAWLPDNVLIFEGARTALWGVETDKDGVESIVRYRLQPGR